MSRIGSVLGQHRQLAPQLCEQHRDQLGVAADARADFGGGARLSAYDQHRAQPLLEELHALRYRRRSNVQRASRALETALAGNCGDGRE